MNVSRLCVLLSACVGACSNPASSVDVAPRRGDTLTVGFLVVDGIYNSEWIAPWNVFHHTALHAEPGMRVFSVAPSRAPVTTFEGLRIAPDHSFDDAPAIDVLVVPSAVHSMDSDLEDRRLIGWVRRTGARARHVLSLCDGAFVLAQAGLLDGRQATTFPADIDALRTRFPAVSVREEVSFVHDGRLITSAGGALSYEAALYFVERLCGGEAARRIGRGLCIDWDLKRIAHVVTASVR